MQRTCIALGIRGWTLALFLLLSSLLPAGARATERSLELSRPIRSWEFLPVVGRHAALFGNEAGRFEAWVYPLKICRNFRLNFLVANRVLSAENLARTLIVRPESSTI